MKELHLHEEVIMSPNNGALCIAIPLYTHAELWLEETSVKFSIGCGKPLAYAIDIGEENLTFLNAEWVEKNLEFLGAL
jgi:hypothetical protein